MRKNTYKQSNIDTKILAAVKKAKRDKIAIIAAFRELAPELNTTASKLYSRWYSFTSKLAVITTSKQQKKDNTCFLALSATYATINRSLSTKTNVINLTSTQYNKILNIIYEN